MGGSQGTKTAEKLSLALEHYKLLQKLTHYAVNFQHLRHIAESTFKTNILQFYTFCDGTESTFSSF
jgi:hypothetical protein